MHTRNCPNNYLSPNHPEWSEEEDWDREKQKEKEHKEEDGKDSKQKELKQKPKIDYQSNPQHTPSFHAASNSEGFIPVLTDMLVPAPEEEKVLKGDIYHHAEERLVKECSPIGFS